MPNQLAHKSYLIFRKNFLREVYTSHSTLSTQYQSLLTSSRTPIKTKTTPSLNHFSEGGALSHLIAIAF